MSAFSGTVLARQLCALKRWVCSIHLLCLCGAAQLTSPVQWETTLKSLLSKGLANSYEVGPNKVIAGIMKRIDKSHGLVNVTV